MAKNKNQTKGNAASQNSWLNSAYLSVRREQVGDFASARIHAANARRAQGVTVDHNRF